MAVVPFPTLRSARLRLREITLHDTNAWFALQSDAEVMRWYGTDPMQTREQMEKLIVDSAVWRVNGAAIRWGLELNGQFIGSCGFARWNKAWHNCTMGYELDPLLHGQGLMHEALACIIDYAFSEMQMHRIQAEIHRNNLASLKLIQKLHFQFEGVHREMGMWGGRWHDLDTYSLLEQEWCDTV